MSDELVTKCTEAMNFGLDFPTIWETMLKPSPRVLGVPIQRLEGTRTYLEVPLVRGDYLVIDIDAKEVRLR
jgi:hypothetical protein